MPVDKHDSDTNFTPTTPDPLDWIKGQIFEFCNKWKSFINIFTENSHADRSTIDMKHIKYDFSLKIWVDPNGLD